MGLKVTNNAFGTLNAGINSTDTVIVLEAGQGARFPVLSAGDYFYATLIDTSNQLEIVKVTARATDTMTVVRAQDGTSSRAYNVNDRFELRPTAALFNEKLNADNPSYTGTLTGGTGVVNLGSGQFYKDASGNVGIGTSSPANRFQTTLTTGAGNPYIGINQTADNPYLEFQRFTGSGSQYGGARIKANGTPDLIFETSNQANIGSQSFTERMRITSAGNVGIGTSSPGTALHVNTTSNSQATFTDANAVQGGLRVGWNGTVGQLYLFENADLRFATNNAERMRITSAGNVGIGTSSPASILNLAGVASPKITLTSSSGPYGYVESNTVGSVGISADEGNTGASTNINFRVDGTERLRITSAGLVGIGTSSPSSRLSVNGTVTIDNTDSIRPSTDDSLITISGGNATNSGANYTLFGSTHPTLANIHRWRTDATERMRIDSSGNLLVGKTASDFAVAGIELRSTDTVSITRSAAPPINVNRIGSSAGPVMNIHYNTVDVGSIDVTPSTTSYNTSSDYRLKHDITPMTGALARVAALKPVTYKWNVDDSVDEGFIAHELAEVCPSAVSGEKDAVNEDGSIKPQGIDTSFLAGLYAAAIQELKAINDAQAQTINAQQAALESIKARLDAANL